MLYYDNNFILNMEDGTMSEQIHKRLTGAQVKTILEKFINKEIDITEAMSLLSWLAQGLRDIKPVDSI